MLIPLWKRPPAGAEPPRGGGSWSPLQHSQKIQVVGIHEKPWSCLDPTEEPPRPPWRLRPRLGPSGWEGGGGAGPGWAGASRRCLLDNTWQTAPQQLTPTRGHSGGAGVLRLIRTWQRLQAETPESRANGETFAGAGTLFTGQKPNDSVHVGAVHESWSKFPSGLRPDP